MRRNVIIAATVKGLLYATRMKELQPQDELNLLLPFEVLSSEKDPIQGGNSSKKSTLKAVENTERASIAALSGHDISVISTKDLLLDGENNEVTVLAKEGRLSIRYTDLIIEVQARARIPRKLNNVSNIFAAPFSDFGTKANEWDALFAKAVSANLPILVTGSGMAALHCVLLANEAGAKILWASQMFCSATATLSQGSQPVDEHFLSYLVHTFGNNLTLINIPEEGINSLKFELSADQTLITGLTDAQGKTYPLAGALWADTIIASHPILKEDGFVLDESGKIVKEDSALPNIHLIGNGAGFPFLLPNENTACGSLDEPYSEEKSVISATKTTNDKNVPPLERQESCAVRTLDTFLFHAGLSLAQATNLGIESDSAILPYTQEEIEAISDEPLYICNGKEDTPVMVIHLVGHKQTGALLGVQVLGRGKGRHVADALSPFFARALSDKVTIQTLAQQEAPGVCAALVAKVARHLQKKISGAFLGISPAELLASREAGADFFLLDVRSKKSWQNKHIVDSYNIPLNDLKRRARAEIPRLLPIAIVSTSSGEAANAATILAGFGASDIYILDGGIALWPFDVTSV